MLPFFNIKKGQFVILLLLICSINAGAQSKQAIIAKIDQTTQSTNQHKASLQYSSKKINSETLKGYRNAKEIVKIVRIKAFPNGKETFEYYFKNGMLMYIQELFESYVKIDAETGKHSGKTEKTFEGHYYFQNNKLIDINTVGHNRFENDAIDPESTLLKEAKLYKKYF